MSALALLLRDPSREQTVQAWTQYNKIWNVVLKKYHPKFDGEDKYEDITQALFRLGAALLICYPEGRELQELDWRITAKKVSLKNVDLSTTEQMINAKIFEWRCAISARPHKSIGNDLYLPAKPAKEGRYKSKPSLQEVIKHNYFELETIFNTSPLEAWEIFKRIQKVAFEEIDRLASISTEQGRLRDKAIEIRHAVQRLKQAVAHKYSLRLNPKVHKKEFTIDLEHIDSIDLYSVKTMLEVECRELETHLPPLTEGFLLGREGGYKPRLSVSKALDLSTENPLGIIKLQPTLWGKSEALLNAESKLNS